MSFLFGPGQNAKILVVDDDGQVLETIEKILKRKGYAVLGFEDPEKALAYLKSEKVDAILTDLQMPGMDGIQFLDHLKQAQIVTPVILMTGFGTISTAVRAMQMGAFDYLSKPFQLQKIYDVVERAVNLGKK